MVIKKCLVDSLGTYGLYQINYALPEPRVKKRGRPSQYDKENREDPRMPPISIAYMYGNQNWVVVERALILEGRIYSRFRKFQHVNDLQPKITKETRYLEANINSLFKKIRLPTEVRIELETAFHKNGQKLEDAISVLS